MRTADVSCAGCHDALVQRGLHATPAIVGKACVTCHLDHRGAQFDLSGWKTMPRFAHDVVWKLNGKHAATPCVQCHTGVMASGRTRFGGLSTTCGAAGCHQANPHRFAGPEFLKCDRCHMPESATWKPAKSAMDFDHDRDTKMPLVGAHRDVRCMDCHPKGQFAIAKTACSGCHKSPKHQSPAFDARPCEGCHAVERKAFAAVRFEHELTKFPLIGGGHRIACARCHTQQLRAAMPSARCESCHPAPSPHGKRFDKLSGGCATCHDGSKWTNANAFAHGRQTKFSLGGKHAEITCKSCHRGDAFEAVQKGCKECHAHATVHDNKYTTQQCTQCHVNNMQDPRPPGIGPIHGPTSPFPLVKGHKNVPCVDCHTERNSRGRTAFENLSTECAEKCHTDSAHDGALGKQCARCHVSGTWDALKFEHDKYALEGEHVNVACAACHGATKKFAGAPRKCADAACHARDDVHGGALGATCDRCHLANGDNRFSHTISAKFKLDGKHLAVPCGDCHPTRAFKPRPMSCFGCHPEPRAHFGKYGTYCERCHTTKAWK